jgi:hypothetical protein
MLSELNQHDRARSNVGALSDSLRQYLYDKYVYRGNGEAVPALEPTRLNVAAIQGD